MTAETTGHSDLTAEITSWYLAEVLVLTSVDEDKSYVLHNNFVLIRANTPESALDAAIVRGRNYEEDFINPAGRKGRVQFVGLRDLHEIHDELEDGAEILYEERELFSAGEAPGFVRPKDSYSVFRPRR